MVQMDSSEITGMVEVESFVVDHFFYVAPSLQGSLHYGQSIEVEIRPPIEGEIAVAVSLGDGEALLYRPGVDILPFVTNAMSGLQTPLASLAGWIILGTLREPKRE